MEARHGEVKLPRNMLMMDVHIEIDRYMDLTNYHSHVKDFTTTRSLFSGWATNALPNLNKQWVV